MIKKIIQGLIKKKSSSCSAVIVAAGSSNRMKGEDKLMIMLNGKTVLERSIELFQNSEVIDEIVIVTRQDLMGYVDSLCRARGFTKVKAITEGGETRVHSVMKGLDHVSAKAGLVAIHDGARPLVTQEVISDTISAALSYYAAAPAIPVKDTIKVAEHHVVTDTPDRSKLFAVQTPQIFDYDLLCGALQKALQEQTPITDDCSAVEALGMRVYLTAGSEENIKITTPIDVILAEAILRRRG